MAAADYDSDLNSEEEEEARTAINIIPADNRFEFTVIKCPVMDDIKEIFPDTMDLLEKWYAVSNCRKRREERKYLAFCVQLIMRNYTPYIHVMKLYAQFEPTHNMCTLDEVMPAIKVLH